MHHQHDWLEEMEEIICKMDLIKIKKFFSTKEVQEHEKTRFKLGENISKAHL